MSLRFLSLREATSCCVPGRPRPGARPEPSADPRPSRWLASSRNARRQRESRLAGPSHDGRRLARQPPSLRPAARAGFAWWEKVVALVQETRLGIAREIGNQVEVGVGVLPPERSAQMGMPEAAQLRRMHVTPARIRFGGRACQGKPQRAGDTPTSRRWIMQVAVSSHVTGQGAPRSAQVPLGAGPR